MLFLVAHGVRVEHLLQDLLLLPAGLLLSLPQVVPHDADDQLEDDEQGDGDRDAGRVEAELVAAVGRRLRRDLDPVVVIGGGFWVGVDVVDFADGLEFLKCLVGED